MLLLLTMQEVTMISVDDLRYWRRDEHVYGREMLTDVHANVLDYGCQVILVYIYEGRYAYATYGTASNPISDASLARLLDLLANANIRKRIKSNNPIRTHQFSTFVGDHRSFTIKE
jgi:hypothetical protein